MPFILYKVELIGLHYGEGDFERTLMDKLNRFGII